MKKWPKLSHICYYYIEPSSQLVMSYRLPNRIIAVYMRYSSIEFRDAAWINEHIRAVSLFFCVWHECFGFRMHDGIHTPHSNRWIKSTKSKSTEICDQCQYIFYQMNCCSQNSNMPSFTRNGQFEQNIINSQGGGVGRGSGRNLVTVGLNGKYGVVCGIWKW